MVQESNFSKVLLQALKHSPLKITLNREAGRRIAEEGMRLSGNKSLPQTVLSSFSIMCKCMNADFKIMKTLFFSPKSSE